MNGENKNRFDALETMRRAAWESFFRRWDIEWKICLALWGALAAFTGAVLCGQSGNALAGCPVRPMATSIVILAAVLILVLHALFIKGAQRANRIDGRKMRMYEHAMRDILQIDFSDDLRALIEPIGKPERMRDRMMSHWSEKFQFGVTLLLAAAAILAVWACVG